MSAPAEICDTCGKMITDEDLETGSAISLLGKSYCSACKEQAMKDISLDDLAGPPVAKTAPPPASTPKPSPPKGGGVEVIRLEAPKDLPPQATPRTVVAPPRAGQRRVPARPSGSKTALLFAGGAIAAGLILAIILLAGSGGSGSGKKDPGPTSSSTKPPPPLPAPPPTDTREEKAEEAYRKAVTVSRRSEASFEEIIAALDRAVPDCRGTKYEAELEKLRAGAIRDKEQNEAVRGLQPLLEELRKAVAADTTFARFGEIQEKFQKARELASRSASPKVGEINQLQQDYAGRYEKAAEPHLKEIEFSAQVLSDDRRYDDALSKIETFPKEFRQSGAWRSLDNLKKEIERKKKLFPPKK